MLYYRLRKELEASPLLRRQLDNLLENGGSVQYGKPGGGTYVNGSKDIYLDPKLNTGNNSVLAGMLAHELGHTLRPRPATPDGGLLGEADAALNNLTVAQEAAANGVQIAVSSGSSKNVAVYRAAYDEFVAAGKTAAAYEAAARKIADHWGVNESPSTCPTINYLQYYTKGC
ncbi:DUF6782 family putative metallopeptidase [Tsukamurella pulmonis]|uniref:DUF6782 family putative metallopeptidase n=1 Tax=Tsukamurella pulmonis TaxID=47312 RepID=UPI001EDEE02E|nr:DUF6782 family putative metallopeptidase [Tsukamurella pulmonis]